MANQRRGPVLLGDQVQITSACPDKKLVGAQATVCTLPRNGQRLVHISAGGGIKASERTKPPDTWHHPDILLGCTFTLWPWYHSVSFSAMLR